VVKEKSELRKKISKVLEEEAALKKGSRRFFRGRTKVKVR